MSATGKNEERKFTQVIDLIERGLGYDVDRDLLKVALNDVDSIPSQDVNVTAIGGTDQTGADLLAALASTTDNDELRIVAPSALDVSAATVPVSSASALDVTITSDDPDAETTELASAADISGGVSTQVNKRDMTLYLENTGASPTNVTVSFSYDGGTTYVNDPDGAISVSNGASDIIEYGYDATHIQVTGDNTEPFNVNLVER